MSSRGTWSELQCLKLPPGTSLAPGRSSGWDSTLLCSGLGFHPWWGSYDPACCVVRLKKPTKQKKPSLQLWGPNGLNGVSSRGEVSGEAGSGSGSCPTCPMPAPRWMAPPLPSVRPRRSPLLPSRSHVRPALVGPAAAGQSARGRGRQVRAVGRAGGLEGQRAP